MSKEIYGVNKCFLMTLVKLSFKTRKKTNLNNNCQEEKYIEMPILGHQIKYFAAVSLKSIPNESYPEM